MSMMARARATSPTAELREALHRVPDLLHKNTAVLATS